MPATQSRLLVITAMLFAGLGGCATPPPASDPDALADYRETNDPLEPTNRAIYAVLPRQGTLSPKVRAFVDFLKTCCADLP